MKEHEKEFLAQVAMGWFAVNAETGVIWRLARAIGGSRSGADSYMKLIDAERAERSRSHGHPKVMFTVVGGKRMQVYAHRIVWMVANHKDIPEGLEINHIDGEPANNHPKNLEVVTRQQNTLHAGQVLGVLGTKEQRGETNTAAKLTAEQVLSVRALCAGKTMAQTKIAELFGVKQSTISAIHLRKSWGHIPASTG